METPKKAHSVTLSNLALTHLIQEMQILQNAFVNNAQTLDNGWLKLKVHTKNGDKTLVFSENAFFISNKSIPAKQNPGGFSAFLKKYVYNQRIVSLTQHKADRIVVFEFPKNVLIVELFAKGNMVLCEKDFKIIKALRKEEWKDRKLQKDEVYKFPSSKGVAPLEETPEAFYDKLQKNEKTSFGAVVDILNAAPAVLEKVFTITGIDKKKNARELTKKEAKELLVSVQRIYEAPATNVYESGGVLYTTDLDLPKDAQFGSINEALNALIHAEQKQETKEEAKVAVKKKDTNVARIALIQKQMAGLEVREKELKEKGDLLYLHYAEIQKLVETIKKGKEKGLKAKEILDRINSVTPMLSELDLEKNKLKLRL